MSSEPKPIYKMLRLKQVVEMTGLPPASIYSEMARGAFPSNVALSANRVAWVEAEVQAWLHPRIEASKKSETSNPRGCRRPKAAADGARPARVPRHIKSTRADGRRSART
ncbi:putative DNA-binding transcriptional regulator AlpA [Afipia massiliensis]|uniref:Putative DNA-binding transcriptional regulator AlpA n=2 Tax=Afipia massiliensis TaxID=211460 RepID=A0A840N452_9BRAD|nr:putative DNA-binding transcriptional regulator AlpA [Afipia massiliensis]